ncbi:hypothetical protein D3C78_1082700 [compost metagenome]
MCSFFIVNPLQTSYSGKNSCTFAGFCSFTSSSNLKTAFLQFFTDIVPFLLLKSSLLYALSLFCTSIFKHLYTSRLQYFNISRLQTSRLFHFKTFTSKPLHLKTCSSTLLFCSSVLLFFYSSALLRLCSSALMLFYSCSSTPLLFYSSALLLLYSSTLLLFCSSALLLFYSSTLLHPQRMLYLLMIK